MCRPLGWVENVIFCSVYFKTVWVEFSRPIRMKKACFSRTSVHKNFKNHFYPDPTRFPGPQTKYCPGKDLNHFRHGSGLNHFRPTQPQCRLVNKQHTTNRLALPSPRYLVMPCLGLPRQGITRYLGLGRARRLVVCISTAAQRASDNVNSQCSWCLLSPACARLTTMVRQVYPPHHRCRQPRCETGSAGMYEYYD